MSTLCSAIDAVLRTPVGGVFNLGARDGMSKADFAFFFAQALDLSTACMERTTTDRVDFLKTYRPKDMRMDSTAFEAAFNMRLPLLSHELKLTCDDYQREPTRASA
jgi:dTDP-4-dehydrorhamnose reductase